MKVLFKKLDAAAKAPAYGSSGSAGADMYALLDSSLTIQPRETVLIHTGIAVQIPVGYVGLICARSGLATKRSLAPANKIGVIDSDYRGEIMIPLHNHGASPATIAPFERIAQLMIVPYLTADYSETDNLDTTERGTGGFGSTGRK